MKLSLNYMYVYIIYKYYECNNGNFGFILKNPVDLSLLGKKFMSDFSQSIVLSAMYCILFREIREIIKFIK